MTEHFEPNHILKFSAENFPKLLQEFREKDKVSIHMAIESEKRGIVIAHQEFTAAFPQDQRQDVIALLSMMPDSHRAEVILKAINKYWKE